MILNINKNVILESMSLMQEEMSPLAKNAMKVGAVGAAAGMAHAGAFGDGIKNTVDGAGSAIAGGAQAIGNTAGNTLKDTGKYYTDKINHSLVNNQAEDSAKHTAEMKASAPHVTAAENKAHDNDNSDDSSGEDGDYTNILAKLGMGAIGAGLGYAGLKGHKAYQGSNVQKNVNNNITDAKVAYRHGVNNMKKSYNAGTKGMTQAGGMNIANKLGGVKRALSGR